jgi:hypothetical protein
MNGHPRSFLASVALLAAVGAAAAGQVQPPPDGPQIQVNTYTTNNQFGQRVDVDASGNFVVVWQSLGSPSSDSSGYSIQGQRYASDGTPLGGQFQINSYTPDFQVRPDLAVLQGGSFVVVWESVGSYGSDDDGVSIQAQRYDAGGNPLGGQFQVNTYTTYDQFSPSVAADGSAGFIVVWSSGSDFGGGPDGSELAVEGQRFDASGQPLGGEFQVNTYTPFKQWYPAVAAGGGGFVVAWQSQGSSGTDTSFNSIHAQRFDPSGNPQGSEFQVNSYTTRGQSYPSVAMQSSGDFVVVWKSGDYTGGPDGSDSSVEGQRFDPNGGTLGGEFQANTYTTNFQEWPRALGTPDGGFLVAWDSFGSFGSDSSGYSVQARRFAADGAPAGTEFQVNGYTTSTQMEPALAADAHGNFVVAWTSFGSSGTDSDYASVQAQRFDALFRDGFESGDAGRWSTVSP